MSRQPVIHRSDDQPRQRASVGIARTRLFDVGIDRTKRIDHYIDYFGNGGGRRVVTADPCGESWLDAHGAQ